MKLSRRCSTSILIVLALLLSGVGRVSGDSKDHPAQQHKLDTAQHDQPIQEKEPQVPSAIWQATVSALRESIADNKQQAIAAQKQAEANKQTFCSPAVIVNEILAVVGAGYLFFMYLQWSAIDQQAKAANRSLNLQFRPKLIVRNIVIAEPVKYPTGRKSVFSRKIIPLPGNSIS